MYTRTAIMVLGAAVLCAGCVATPRNGDGDSSDLVLRVTDSNGTVTELAHAQILGDNTKGVVTLIDGAIQLDIPLSKVSSILVPERTGKMEMTVTLKSGEKRTGWMNMAPVRFVGQTAIGQAQIRMFDVREVENVTR
jgi:hypothetical protein